MVQLGRRLSQRSGAQPSVATSLPPYLPISYQVMAKPRGAICNLDCAYCYYLEKEELYPEGSFRMDAETLEAYVKQYVTSQLVPHVTFAWQGGEPTLMGLDFYRRAVALQQEYAPPGMTVVNAFQTNGTTLDDAWCSFFRENDFLIGISIDGPREMHDAYRLDKGGAPTFDRVINGLRLLQKHGVEFNVLTTLHAANVRHPLKVYRFLRDEASATHIQFIPIVEPESQGVSERSVTGAAYGAFLNRVFDEWIRRDVGSVSVQSFDQAYGAFHGGGASLCVHRETCGNALVIEHNGDVYSCDHFVRPEHRLGNIRERRLRSMAGSQAQHDFGEAKSTSLPRQCRACDVRVACNGGCPKDRLLSTVDGETGLNYLCEGYRTFFRHVREPLAQLTAWEN
jgi:uncharacterized protein